MKYCPYCGEVLREQDTRFCPECGEALSDKEPDLVIEEVEDSGYDGYYDDVLPMDLDERREGIDKSLVKKVVLLAVGVAFVIGGCIALMYLL